MGSVDVVLRYFPVQGRAQALRHALTDGAVAFDDVRVALADWPQRREELDFAGPQRALPTLNWGEALLTETLPIASFLARRLGHYDCLDETAAARFDAIISSCYVDIQLRFAELIRCDVRYPGADLARAAAVVVPTVIQKAELLDAQLPDGGWLGTDRPIMPDFFAAEAWELLRYVLGPDRNAALATRLPRLWRLGQRMRARPELARAWETRPARFTARPDEEAVIELLRRHGYA